MQEATIVLGMIVAVLVLVFFSSTRMRMQGPRGPQGQFGPNQQGPGQWGQQQPGYTPGQQQQQGSTGNLSGSYGARDSRGSSGLLQFFAIVGVLVILGACGLMVLALQGGIQ